MSEPIPPTSQPGAVPPATWSEVWKSALSQPSVATYERIASAPDASSARAYLWVLSTALIGFALSTLILLALGAEGFTLIVLVCGAPVAAVVSSVGFAAVSGLSHVIARALGGEGTYDQLAYALAAFIAPLTLVTSAVSPLPVLTLLIYPLGIYGIVLNLIAVKATHRFSWARALVSSAGILAIVCVAIVVVVMLALLGDAVGDVFSNISDQLSTPAP